MNITKLASLRLAISLACAGWLVAGPAIAQQDTTNTQTPQQSKPDKSKPAPNTTTLQSVTVTATKRKEDASHIAGGISAVTGDQLENIGAQSFSDYLGRMPGVVFNAGPAGDSTAVIRGVGTTAGLDQGQGPTGYFINEVPLSEPGYAIGIPDIDTFDVDRVEVLRGPQGTLFGSASLGGAINYVANEADPSGFHAALETSVSGTYNANGNRGNTLKGMVNVPIIDDKLAVRVVMLERDQPGYLDNIGLNRKASNDTKVRGGRISVVWTPWVGTKVTWLSMVQNGSTADFSYMEPAYGDLKRSTLLPEKFNTTFSLHSLRLDQDVGFATLTTILSYNHKSHVLDNDDTPFYGGFGGIAAPVLYEEQARSATRTAEIRLASPTDKDAKLDWLVGANYLSTNKSISDFLSASDANQMLSSQYPANDLRGNEFYWGNANVNGSEKAVFGEANWHFADHWTFTVGGRWYDDRVSSSVQYNGVFYDPVYAPPATVQKQTGFVPKYSITWNVTPDFTAYALISKGYRFGNPNTIYPLAGFDTPSGWKTDTLWNYEAGLKSYWLDHSLQLDVSAFYIDWSDIQVRLYRPDGVTYGTNAGGAHIHGVETSSAWRPTSHIELSANLTWLDAQLSQSVLAASTPLYAGQVLPGASKWQASVIGTYRWSGEHSPTFTVTDRQVSGAPANLQQPYYRINGYNQLDARFSLLYGNTEISLYGTNLADRRGVTFSYGDFGAGLQDFVILPRTIGLRLNWQM
ncbi:TonB-dependent receptor [Rhodanobacter sp. MP1X3]|uniref:TonB-dependent receptor n=1 Tax=Rhodanobacter sp. MP1X3 TaxID=2723086 RepID=UPI00161ED4BC|nr:TonB-dependent receptor [Rhodanobacter sp. MP1X3]MBB6244918.1 outer membrane receptor protein involved in Fe transport [Rhodanobacter sp. MP1X3]